MGPYLDISSPPNASKYPLLDVAEDKARLLEALEPMVEESLGMAMVFSLVSTLKDAAETLISDRQRAAEEVKEVEARKVEEIENRKFHGTVVTKDRFLEWRANFKKELAEKERLRKEEEEADEKKKRGKVEEKKLSGRQLWERGLVGKGEDEDVDGEDTVEAVGKLKVSG